MQSLYCTRAVRVRLQASNVWAAPPGRVQPRPNVRTAPRMRTTAAKLRPESRPKPSRVWQGPLRVGWAESASPIRPDIPGCTSRNAAAGGLPSGPPINPRLQVVGPGALGTFADQPDASIAPIFGRGRRWEPRHRPRRKWPVPVGQVRRPALHPPVLIQIGSVFERCF